MNHTKGMCASCESQIKKLEKKNEDYEAIIEGLYEERAVIKELFMDLYNGYTFDFGNSNIDPFILDSLKEILLGEEE